MLNPAHTSILPNLLCTHLRYSAPITAVTIRFYRWETEAEKKSVTCFKPQRKSVAALRLESKYFPSSQALPALREPLGPFLFPSAQVRTNKQVPFLL